MTGWPSSDRIDERSPGQVVEGPSRVVAARGVVTTVAGYGHQTLPMHGIASPWSDSEDSESEFGLQDPRSIMYVGATHVWLLSIHEPRACRMRTSGSVQSHCENTFVPAACRMAQRLR